MLNLLSAIVNQNVITKVQMYKYDRCSVAISNNVTMYQYDKCEISLSNIINMYQYDRCTFGTASSSSSASSNSSTSSNSSETSSSSSSATPPEGETLVCTISGAGTSAVNGDYYTDANHPACVAKHVSQNYWIRINQYHMGSPAFDYYSYMIYDSPTTGTHYYEWYCVDSLTCSSIGITNGASPAPTSTRGSEIHAVVCHAGSTLCNGVYKTSSLGGGVLAEYTFNTPHQLIVGTLGPPDYNVITEHQDGSYAEYRWSASSSIPLISDVIGGNSPGAIIYN